MRLHAQDDMEALEQRMRQWAEDRVRAGRGFGRSREARKTGRSHRCFGSLISASHSPKLPFVLMP